MDNKLIFVYNANSNFFSTITDFVHKALRPETYECNLCKLTHSNFGMKKEWRDFLKTLAYKLEFLHKDEFAEQYPNLADQALPLILRQTNETKVILNAQEINQAQNLMDLKNLIIKITMGVNHD